MLPWPTDAERRAGVDAYNRFLADFWNARQEELAARIAAEAPAVGDEPDSLIKDLSHVRLDAAVAPGMQLTPSPTLPGVLNLSLVVPLAGPGWNVSFRAKARLKKDSTKWHTVKVKIKGLKVRVTLPIETLAPVAARIRSAARVTVSFAELDLDSTNVALDLLFEIVEPFVRALVKRQARKSLADALPNPARVQAIGDLRLASQPPAVTDEPLDAAALERLALAISDSIQRHHLPWGTLLTASLSKEDPDGPPVAFRHFEDSAIWTGHYLAAEALRFAAGDRRAAGDALAALRGLEALTNLAGEPGLLSRVLVPADSPHVAGLEEDVIGHRHAERLFTAEWQGRAVRAVGHVTRDQYAGAFLGTGLAALLIDEPAVRALARKTALDMATYVVSRGWSPSEAVADEHGIKRTSVTYAANPLHALAILRLAATLDPERFEGRYRDMLPVWSVLWVFEWLLTLDPHRNYYKFNLDHSLAVLLLHLEPDRETRARLAHGFLALRQALGGHDNAWFSGVELLTLGDRPELLTRPAERIRRELRSALVLWAKRSRTMEKIDLTGDPTIDKAELPGLGDDDKPVLVARQALPVDRRPSTDFLWQRSPFSLRGDLTVPEDVLLRPPGVDFLLPYWLARVLGIV